MGEKGNLLDTSQEIFANLAEQGPQFWIAYEQYKLARGKDAPAHVDAEHEQDARDVTAQWPRPPGAG
jgi:hypothetical protein